MNVADKVFTDKDELKAYVEANYDFTVLRNVDNIRFYEIKGLKEIKKN